MSVYERITDPRFWQEPHEDCNCGSFALGVNTWFQPYDNGGEYTFGAREALMREMWEEGHTREYIMDTIIELDQEEILRQCPWVEPVLLQNTKPEDRIVAYRLSMDKDDFEMGEFDEDYHFRVRIDGAWFEKCGEDPIEFCGLCAEKTPWRAGRFLTYDGKIKYFRFKEI